MPIYMDIHDTTEATVEDVAADHQRDFTLQDKFNCRFIYFWHDVPNNTGFCVFEAPDKESVINLHNASHGHTPNQIIEVELSEVEFFLGKIANIAWSNKNSPFDGYINGTVHRTIMFLEIVNPIFFKPQTSNNKFADLKKLQTKIIKDSFLKFEGNEISWENNSILTSFLSEENAINCAVDIQNKFTKLSEEEDIKFSVSIGLSFGAPVTESADLYGDVISLAKKLGYIAGENQILISSSLGKVYNELKLKTNLKNNLIKILSSHNENLLNLLFNIFEQKWNEEEFNIDSLVKRLGMSKAQLYRKIISLTGYSPNVFIREYRLKKALKLLESMKGNISEIAFESGFSNPSYFAKCFQKKFGILPSEYANYLV
jgi:AraC-like DNA-binding protein